MTLIQLGSILHEVVPILLSLLALWRGYRNKNRLIALETECFFPHVKCTEHMRRIEERKGSNG